MTPHWEQDVVGVVNELTTVQEDLLRLLSRKRQYLRAGDVDGMLSLKDDEHSIAERLQALHQRRGRLLEQAAQAGLPGDSMQSLLGAVASPTEQDWGRKLDQAAQRSRLLQHQSLSQWVVVQRTLLHLSQMLEIIATGGRTRPTYEQRDSFQASGQATGTLVDDAA